MSMWFPSLVTIRWIFLNRNVLLKKPWNYLVYLPCLWCLGFICQAAQYQLLAGEVYYEPSHCYGSIRVEGIHGDSVFLQGSMHSAPRRILPPPAPCIVTALPTAMVLCAVRTPPPSKTAAVLVHSTVHGQNQSLYSQDNQRKHKYGTVHSQDHSPYSHSNDNPRSYDQDNLDDSSHGYNHGYRSR